MLPSLCRFLTNCFLPAQPGAASPRLLCPGSFQCGLPTIVAWLCVNLLALKVLGIARFGYRAVPGMVCSRWPTAAAHHADGQQRTPLFLRIFLKDGDGLEGPVSRTCALDARKHLS